MATINERNDRPTEDKKVSLMAKMTAMFLHRLGAIGRFGVGLMRPNFVKALAPYVPPAEEPSDILLARRARRPGKREKRKQKMRTKNRRGWA